MKATLSGLLRVVLLALCAFAGLAQGADIRVVSVSFIPSSITWDALSTLRVELRNNALGGQRQSVDYLMVVPAGLSIVSEPLLGQDCSAAAVTFEVEGDSTSVRLVGLTLQPSGTCTVDVTVAAPPVEASYTFTEAELAPPGSPRSATLTVGAPPAAAMALSKTEVTFPAQEVGIASAAQAVTVTNTGEGTLGISGISASGDFEVSGDCATATLAPGASCTFGVVFSPQATGARTGTIQIASSVGASSIGLSGEGIAPLAVLTPSPLAFGSIVAGASATSNVTLTNAGTAALTIAGIAVSGSSFFSVSHDCPGLLAVADSCVIAVTYAPTATGEHAGEVLMGSNTPANSRVLALSGSAMSLPVPVASLSRDSVDFGAQTLGIASNPRVVTVSSAGTGSLDILSIAATGDFGFDGCATPLSLAPGDSCELAISFLPTAAGDRSGSISIWTSAAGSPHAIALSGTGTPAPVPGIAIAPTAVDFGSIEAGTSAVTHLSLTNTGTAALSIAGISISSADFTYASTCTETLAAKAACDISVTYAPSGEGAHSAELHVVSNAAPSPLVVPLFGFATPVRIPLLDLSSTSVVFAPLFVGQTSAPRTVTLTNYGLEPLRIGDIVSTGDFGYSGCGAATTLLTGQSCTFAITFRPLSVGTRSGAIQVRSNAPGSPHTISLSGTGVPYAVPEISLNPPHLSFGAQPVGSGVAQVMTLTNAGGAALQISAISASGSFFTQANDCPASMTVGATCRIIVAYTPTMIGAHNGQVVIVSNAEPATYVVPLSGSASTSTPAFLSAARQVDFGEQVMGETARETLLLENTGGEPLLITWARILGEPEFAVENPCGTILPGASCELEVTFTPTALREFTARLDILSNHPAGMVQIPLEGEGVPRPRPALKLSVDGLGWGNQVVGSMGEARVVQVTSTGGLALRIHSVHATPDFVVNAAQCPELLEPKASCDIVVNFKPIVPGRRLGRLAIISNAAEGNDSVSLSGVGCRFFSMGAARNPSRLCAP